LVTQIHKILTEKSSIIYNMQSNGDDELSCEQWFSTAVPCLCSIETKRLKPKQLFCGKYTKYLVIHSD